MLKINQINNIRNLLFKYFISFKKYIYLKDKYLFIIKLKKFKNLKIVKN